MTKLNPVYVYLAVGVALIMGWFYWNEYRPMQVKEYCTEELLKRLDKDKPDDWVRSWAVVCIDAGGPDNVNAAVEARQTP